MIASQESHSISLECANRSPAFLEQGHLPSLYIKDGSKHKEAKRIVSLDEIVWIEGNISVTF